LHVDVTANYGAGLSVPFNSVNIMLGTRQGPEKYPLRYFPW